MNLESEAAPDLRLAPIRPERIAEKLAAIRNYEFPNHLEQITARPRLVEMLWFIQAMSLRPGALVKFAEALLAEFPERLGTPKMRAPQGKRYSLETKIDILAEFPACEWPSIPQEKPDFRPNNGEFYTAEERAELDAKHRRELESAGKEIDPDWFASKCAKAARSGLPDYLASLCVHKLRGFDQTVVDAEPRQDWAKVARRRELQCVMIPERPLSNPWYFHDVCGAVIEFMDRHASKVQKRLAITKVARLVFDALDYAADQKVMTHIAGLSRFGKTEAVQTWCDMRPGLARLVTVPCDNSMESLHKRFGEALGMDFSHDTTAAKLKARLEHVIKHGGIFFVLDESHFLLPQTFSRTSCPRRLNWIRTEIVDRGLPLALSFTPQDFKVAVNRFVKTTGYDMAQFSGRVALPCVLPETLSEEDLIAVARIHFPELGKNALGYIANTARITQNYLQAVQAIAKRARYLAARRDGKITLDDIETAIAEVLPQMRTADRAGAAPEMPAAPSATVRTPRSAAPLQHDRKPAARPMRPARSGEDFPDSSLRRDGADMDEPEVISADS